MLPLYDDNNNNNNNNINNQRFVLVYPSVRTRESAIFARIVLYSVDLNLGICDRDDL